MNIRCMISLWTGFCLAGCMAFGPNYKRPNMDSPPSFRSGSAATNGCKPELAWWVVNHDPQRAGPRGVHKQL